MTDGARVRSGGTRTPNGTVGFVMAGARIIAIPANATTPAEAKAAVVVWPMYVASVVFPNLAITLKRE